jgi:radical SAM protein with 4Fe4S-binding SPASM domain
MLDEPKVKISSLSQSWGELKEKTQKTTLCEECAVCKHRHVCSVCAAMMYSETGSFIKKPEYVCRFTHELIRPAENV